MNAKTKTIFIYIIGLFFLMYGGIRLGVSSLLLMQLQGMLNVPDLQEGWTEVINFMSMKESIALVPLSAGAYLIYLWLMAVTIIIGAVGCFYKKPFGLTNLYVFLGLHAMLFVNFLTINPKILYLVGCGLLVGCYRWLLTN